MTVLIAALLAALATSAPADGAVLLAAGDVASCRSRGDEATARLLDRLPGTVALLGDAVYERGTAAEFRDCFSWRRHRARIRPAVGNHEYLTPGARGYFSYFGRAAGPAGRGWYGYDLGAWHVVVLNSNCSRLPGGCARGSPQERWLRRDLAAHPARCTLAYMHHPRFSSGLHGDDRTVQPLWDALYRGGVDVVLAGHDHHYERFAPMTPAGRVDRRRGIRSFVVGTGGRSLYPAFLPRRGSERRSSAAYGVLALRLRPDGYDWRFEPAAGSRLRDAGSAPCL